MPGPTIPPTAAEVDACGDANSQNINGLVFTQADANQTVTSVTNTWFLYGYTQFNGTQVFGNTPSDPTTDEASAFMLQQLAAVYGAVTVREYTTTAAPQNTPSADLAADGTEQARISNPANWVPVP
jgi:hypothetical protein